MKEHLTGFGVSALIHVILLLAVLPAVLWQDKPHHITAAQPVPLSLAQFVPAPPPSAEPPALPPVAEAPQPKPKPVEKPKPKAKPLEKPKPKPKPIEKPKPKAKPLEKPKPKPIEKPKPKQESKRGEESQMPPPIAQRPLISPPPINTPRPAKPAPQAIAPAPVGDNKAAEAAYRAKLQNLIAARKQYPRMAERAEVEGSVVVTFTIMPNGKISGARVTKSAGNDWLDKAAVKAVNSVSGALPFPAEIRKSQWVFSLTVNFRLDD